MKIKHIKPTKGAGIVFWKKENGRKYVLLAKRTHGFGKGKYSNLGGHCESSKDKENGKLCYLTTAIRECAEEASLISDYSYSNDKAKAFFLGNPDFKLSKKPFRKICVPFYHYETFLCEVTGDKSNEKWFSESWEHEAPTMKWYALNKLPRPILFACLLNIIKVFFAK